MDQQTAHKPRRAVAARHVVLEVLNGPNAGLKSNASTEIVAVGTAPDNEVVLSDPTVSRYHLECQPDKIGILVRDLDSRNGTYLGPVRIDQAVVPSGTQLVIGSTTLVVKDGSGKPRSPSEGEECEIPGLVGSSEAMRALAAEVRKLAASDVAVLIQGETGTGKEVVAQTLHRLSKRHKAPLVVVDCGSMPATLIASELFGHERGAFTGADRRHAGAFERAHGGTVFLDEIGELPLQLQPTLLGALERKTVRRLGGDKDMRIDVRIVAATNRDLRKEVNRGTFRADLYFRLAVARITLLPLRERSEDVEALVTHFVRELLGEDAEVPFGPEAMERLRTHVWSGNVRELRNVVESALALGKLQLSAEGERGSSAEAGWAEGDHILAYRQARAKALDVFENEYLTELMTRCAGNASEAARRASMDRPYLLSLLRKHGLR